MERPSDSRTQPSLDEIVTRSAAVIAEQIQKAAALAKSEMDLQIDVAAALKKFAADAKITLEGHHNVTIATGRPDSVYGSVIVEYKAPVRFPKFLINYAIEIGFSRRSIRRW